MESIIVVLYTVIFMTFLFMTLNSKKPPININRWYLVRLVTGIIALSGFSGIIISVLSDFCNLETTKTYWCSMITDSKVPFAFRIITPLLLLYILFSNSAYSSEKLETKEKQKNPQKNTHRFKNNYLDKLLLSKTNRISIKAFCGAITCSVLFFFYMGPISTENQQLAKTHTNTFDPQSKSVVAATTDGGETWQRIWSGKHSGPHIKSVLHHPHEKNKVFLLPHFINDPSEQASPKEVLQRGPGLLVTNSTDSSFSSVREWKGLEKGTVVDIAIDPKNYKCAYATVSCRLNDKTNRYLHHSFEHATEFPNGIYKSTDGGIHWKISYSSALDNLPVGNGLVAVSPADSRFIYVVTEYQILRSTDSGNSWKVIAGGSKSWMPTKINNCKPTEVICGTKDAAHLWVATSRGGILESCDGGRSWQLASNNFHFSHISSIDTKHSLNTEETVCAVGPGGAWFYTQTSKNKRVSSEWVSLNTSFSDVFLPFGFSAVEIFFDKSNLFLLASGGTPPTMSFIESKKTTSNDSVKNCFENGSWDFSVPLEITCIKRAPSNSDVIYAATSNPYISLKHEPCMYGAGVLVSTDGGTTWDLRSKLFPVKEHDVNFSQKSEKFPAITDLTVHPQDESWCIAATSNGLLISEDYGKSWRFIDSEFQDFHPRVVAFMPNEPFYLVCGCDNSGLYIVKDKCRSINKYGSHRKEFTAFSDMIFDPQNPGYTYAADYNKGIFYSSDYGKTWKKCSPDVSSFYPVDLKLSDKGRFLYCGTDGMGVFRLELNKLINKSKKNSIQTVRWESLEGPPGGNIIAFLRHPTQPQQLFAAEEKCNILVRNPENGEWDSLNSEWLHHGIFDNEVSISAFELNPSKPDEFWIGTQGGGRLIIYDQKSGHTKTIDPQFGFLENETTIQDIAISPHNEALVYVVYEGLFPTIYENRPSFTIKAGLYNSLSHIAVFMYILMVLITGVSFLITRNNNQYKSSIAVILCILAVTIGLEVYNIFFLADFYSWVWLTIYAAAGVSGLFILGKNTLNKLNHEPCVDMNFINYIQQPVLITDLNYHIIASNKSSRTLFNFSEKTFLGQNLNKLVSVSILSESNKNNGQASSSPDPFMVSNSILVECKQFGGELIDCILTFSRFKGPDGSHTGYIFALTNAEWLIHVAKNYGLTKRETEVLRYLLRGDSYQEMAKSLCITEATLKTHIHHIYEKTGAQNRIHLRTKVRGDSDLEE